ncbi:FAD-binding oxidoreductase [Curvibacter sp. HBC61]|uniref:FAD-binding oxidoreductase n=1 Tax=Curvibacter cyanobacteriorum TaxID=3026422 RepID=A0ABT5MVZ6_9BURK|nr:FAD-binding oxidoreductase [Curvibacter sp. HBC61]MDD0838227.1 FAD-binding oxidoreductase [Curvibacter sp. HBC61]
MTTPLHASPVSTDDIVQALTAIVGPQACLTQAPDLKPFVTDYRGLYVGQAAAVVLPNSTQQVSQVMAWCHAHGVVVVPQGGNTSLMGGAVPEAQASSPAVVLNLRRMNQVLAVDTVNDTLTLQAGVTLNAARSAAEDAGRLFPLRIGSEGSCQIGGNISTNAGGTAVLRYGNMRDLVLGVEAVLPDGRIYSGLRGLRKDNTGYDLKQLFIGSEGTLGIVTAAVLKLMPQPTASSVALAAVASPAAAVALLGEAKKTAGQAVTAFELISGPALDLVLGYLGNVKSPFEARHDWMVLIELTSGASAEGLDATLMQVLEAGLDSGLVLDATLAQSGADAQTFWRIREEISDAQTRTGGSIKCDVSVPLSRIAAFIDEATAAVLALEPQTRMIVYGHMGDGNVHFNPLRPADRPAKDYLAAFYEPISRQVDSLAHAAGGSISAEHGVGVAKRDDLSHYKSDVELALMWQIKNALDPQGLLNPGKVLPAPVAAPVVAQA